MSLVFTPKMEIKKDESYILVETSTGNTIAFGSIPGPLTHEVGKDFSVKTEAVPEQKLGKIKMIFHDAINKKYQVETGEGIFEFTLAPKKNEEEK